MNEYIWLNLEIKINYFIYLITQLDINRKIEHYARWTAKFKGGGGPREGYVYRGGVGVGDFRYFYNVNLFLWISITIDSMTTTTPPLTHTKGCRWCV